DRACAGEGEAHRHQRQALTTVLEAVWPPPASPSLARETRTMHNNTVPTANNHRPDNDNCPVGSFALSFGRSTFPRDAVARIYRPARSAMTSARPRRAWRLSFERRSAPFIEPLMGYTGSRD